MKKIQRLPKGEKYWYLKGNLEVVATTDIDSYIDASNWLERNYFHTEEEARSMLKKLRAVLKGADAIEMPSEEEIESVASKICHEIEKYGIVSGHSISGYMTSACKSMADFFNNKIVK